MRIIAFITDYAVVDRIINHLKLSFVAESPPPRIVYQEVLMAAETPAEYFSWAFFYPAGQVWLIPRPFGLPFVF